MRNIDDLCPKNVHQAHDFLTFVASCNRDIDQRHFALDMRHCRHGSHVLYSCETGALFDDLLLAAPGWPDLVWLKSITHLPILIKGVLHEDDARLAVELGLDGIIVSNHGGRTLDTVPATANVLARIVDAADHLPVLVDGGIRRGNDVLKALALGATAVLIGRPFIYGLANAGAVGVAHVLRLLRDELEVAMALSGVATIDQITPELIYRDQS